MEMDSSSQLLYEWSRAREEATFLAEKLRRSEQRGIGDNSSNTEVITEFQPNTLGGKFGTVGTRLKPIGNSA